MSLNITKYREVENQAEGVWFKVPADVFGIKDEVEVEKLDIQFKLKPYPDKILREHSRKATKPFNITGRRRQTSTNIDDRFDTEKFRKLKYCYIIEDFKGITEGEPENETSIECTDENKMGLLEIFSDLADWIDEQVENINNFIKEEKEAQIKNL